MSRPHHESRPDHRLPQADHELLIAARSHAYDPAQRQRVLETLIPMWRQFPLSEACTAAIDRLKNEGTQIVITGQQPALFGGPLMILLKALSAAQLAAQLTELGQPTVALFWIADDDHDVQELASGFFGVEKWNAKIPFESGRVPVSQLRVDPDLLLSELSRDGGLPDDLLAILKRTADPSPAVWFRQVLMELTADTGLLPVHPEMLRGHMAPYLADELRHPGRLRDEVSRTIPGLAEDGITPPIPEARELPLFIHDDSGARHRLVSLLDGSFRLQVPEHATPPQLSGGNAADSYTVEDLAALVEADPGRATPDALLRVLIQDSIFEPVATVCGPTELDYQLELATSYQERKRSRPLLIPRLRVRMIDDRSRLALQGLGLDPAELTPQMEPQELVPSASAERASREIEDRAQQLFDRLRRLGEDADHGSHALSRRVSRLLRRWQGDMDKLIASIAREYADEETRKARELAGSIRDQLWPGGRPAERVRSALDVLAACSNPSTRFARIQEWAAAFDAYDAAEKLIVCSDCSGSEVSRA